MGQSAHRKSSIGWRPKIDGTPQFGVTAIARTGPLFLNVPNSSLGTHFELEAAIAEERRRCGVIAVTPPQMKPETS
jgi:hypothetical protein